MRTYRSNAIIAILVNCVISLSTFVLADDSDGELEILREEITSESFLLADQTIHELRTDQAIALIPELCELAQSD